MNNLFVKELRDEMGWIIGIAGFVLGVNLLMYLFSGNRFISSSVSLAITSTPMYLYVFLKSIGVFKDEWDRNTIYTLFSLPIRGYEIVLTKIGVVVLEVFLYYTLALFVPYILTLPENPLGISLYEVIKMIVFFSMTASLIIPFPVFAYIVGRYSPKLKGLVTFGVLAGTGILYGKILPLLRQIFSTVPGVTISIHTTEIEISKTLPLDWFFATLLFGLILVYFSSLLIEKVEV